MKLWNTLKVADWHGVNLGWVRHRWQSYKYASWRYSSKPRNGENTATDSGTCMSVRTLEQTLRRMASRQSGSWDQASHWGIQQTTGSHSVHRWLGHQRPGRMGLHCKERSDHHPWRQYRPYKVTTSSLWMEKKAVTHAPAGLPREGTARLQCHHSNIDSSR